MFFCKIEKETTELLFFTNDDIVLSMLIFRFQKSVIKIILYKSVRSEIALIIIIFNMPNLLCNFGAPIFCTSLTLRLLLSTLTSPVP